MKNTTLFIILVFLLSSEAVAVSMEKLVRMKELELDALKNLVTSARDSLQEEIVQRYSFKQQIMEQRESDKEEFDRLKENQEQVSNQLSQLREEVLTLQQRFDDQKKETLLKTEEWNGIKSSIGELFEKEAVTISETFPLDLEKRRSGFEELRRQFTINNSPQRAIFDFVNYKSEFIRNGTELLASHEKILLENGPPVSSSIIRFGNVFAYGIDLIDSCFIIRQTGNLGAEKYSANRIGAPQISSFLQTTIPQWLSQGKISGRVMVDLMQNDQSRQLIAGKKVSYWEETLESVKQGGAIMIPLLLLPFWVLYILLRKSIQIFGRRFVLRSQYNNVIRQLENKNFDSATSFLKKSKGAMARVMQTCLEKRDSDRLSCERIVREIIYHEIPVISRGINTMAVIAGAAPLVGLLGTISGMITLFAAVTHFGTGDPKFLAGGISEALITAKTGLAIAIPALFFHDFLRGAKERYIAQVEESTTHLLNMLWPEG